jgi:hypothetical protein
VAEVILPSAAPVAVGCTLETVGRRDTESVLDVSYLAVVHPVRLRLDCILACSIG